MYGHKTRIHSCLFSTWGLFPFQIYILKVDRVSQNMPSFIFRRYSEFQELHHKLLVTFPLAKLPSLSGRSVSCPVCLTRGCSFLIKKIIIIKNLLCIEINNYDLFFQKWKHQTCTIFERLFGGGQIHFQFVSLYILVMFLTCVRTFIFLLPENASYLFPWQMRECFSSLDTFMNIS